MRRHETPRATAMPVRRPIGFQEQLLGIVVLLFAFVIQVSLDEILRQIPAGIWSAMLVSALGTCSGFVPVTDLTKPPWLRMRAG